MSDTAPQRPAAKPLLIGCGVGLALLLLGVVFCAGGFGFLGFRGFQAFHAEVKQAADDEKFAQRWTPPAEDAGVEAFAPASAAGYDLASSDERAAFPALGIEHAGTHAVYRRGEDAVDVSAYRADEAETTAIFDEVVRRLDDPARFKSRSITRSTRTLRFAVSDPVDLNGVLWHARGWLIFAHSPTVSDLDPFLKAYLTAVQGSSGEEPEDAAARDDGAGVREQAPTPDAGTETPQNEAGRGEPSRPA